jgi:hypothetical protein
MMTTTYLSPAETAKLVRQALKANFPELPGRFFSVRSSSYSGGGSIDIKWEDGPTEREVKRVVCRFEGSTFDGMIDLKSPKPRTLLAGADGELREVSFGSDFVFTKRSYSDRVTDLARARILERWGAPEGYDPDRDDDWNVRIPNGPGYTGGASGEYLDVMIWRELAFSPIAPDGAITWRDEFDPEEEA